MIPTGSDPSRGALAGLLATVPQTLAMQAVRLVLPGPRGPFPPRQVTEAIVRRALGRVRWSEPIWWTATALSHFGFGTAAGAAYPIVVRPTPVRGFLYGLAVGFVSYELLMPAAGVHSPQHDRPVRKQLQLIAAHLAWGVTMSALFEWLGRLPDQRLPDERHFLGRQ